jgi:hypothetical protein
MMQTLLPADRISGCWRRIESMLTEELQRLREANDNRGLSLEETAYMRGKIAQTKEFLALGKPPEEVTDD